MAKKAGTVKNENMEVIEVKMTEKAIKTRRANGMGSVYPINNGKKYGFCIGLTDTNNEEHKKLRKKYGNKLRLLGTAKTKEECEEKCKLAIKSKDLLLQEKLKKLNYKE